MTIPVTASKSTIFSQQKQNKVRHKLTEERVFCPFRDFDPFFDYKSVAIYLQFDKSCYLL